VDCVWLLLWNHCFGRPFYSSPCPLFEILFYNQTLEEHKVATVIFFWVSMPGTGCAHERIIQEEKRNNGVSACLATSKSTQRTLYLPASVTNEQTLYQNMHHLNYRLESSIVFVLDEKLNHIEDSRSSLRGTATCLVNQWARRVGRCIHSVGIRQIHLFDIYATENQRLQREKNIVVDCC
jgi:hypothetical protein